MSTLCNLASIYIMYMTKLCYLSETKRLLSTIAWLCKPQKSRKEDSVKTYAKQKSDVSWCCAGGGGNEIGSCKIGTGRLKVCENHLCFILNPEEIEWNRPTLGQLGWLTAFSASETFQSTQKCFDRVLLMDYIKICHFTKRCYLPWLQRD